MSEAMRMIFQQALAVTGKGMLALFAFMFLFYVLLVVVDRIFPGKESASSD
ncbi:MAG: hypothetical protein PHX05_03780 [Acidobacteriota bacterium]|jgi:hypothetical protein|nr:hypothetical protein [Acidobacteriota bacterium]